MRFLAKRAAYLAFVLVQRLYPRSAELYLHIRAFLVATLVFLAGLFIFVLAISDVGEVYRLKSYQPPTPSRLLDRKGRLITTFFQDMRVLVNIDEIPLIVKHAFVAMEDNRFYEHPGIDVQGILRAFFVNLFAADIKQGGSTITQQLAKVLLTGKERTLKRKLKEALLALVLDAHYSKEEILHLYFNEIYFGHGTYGVTAASQFYFNKDVNKLSLGEAALLATLPAAPNLYSPAKNPHLSKERLLLALARMVDRGFITKSQAEKAYQEMQGYYASLNISPTETAYGRRVDEAPFYSETVRQILEKELGKSLLYEGGLTIHGTLDLDHQRAAQAALSEGLRRQNAISRNYIFTRYEELAAKHAPELELLLYAFNLPPLAGGKKLSQFTWQLAFFNDHFEILDLLHLTFGEKKLENFLHSIRSQDPFLNRTASVQGALLEIDHKTGEVTALVGGSSFNAQNQINRALQMRRQVGSTFKPILYAAAIDLEKVTAATVFSDSPVVFLDEQGSEWLPENYSGVYRGFIPLREALAISANMVSIAVAREVGLSLLLPKLGKILGISEKQIPYNLSVALGSFELSPYQMAKSFALFPRGGRQLEPYLIRYVEDREGRRLLSMSRDNSVGEQLLKPGTAAIVTSLLEEAVNRGTGRSIRQAGYVGYAAGKTGTTNNYRDAWFVGFNKRYTTAVWVGYDRPSLSLGIGHSGAGVAAPIWAQFNQKIRNLVEKEEEYLVFEGFVKVPICRKQRLLPKETCAETYEELFLPGTEPKTEEALAPLPELPRQIRIDDEEFFANDDRT
ncbi:MAG: PBP1A family penicillin-binding protein [Leptospiraceae bacterium]|nr:PBP1A family penicillin-binding protein [Leptospiraceae bacterium]MDW8306983.1 PBP1A family penicillin-binding protein [Leptospiraceae bacterium]